MRYDPRRLKKKKLSRKAELQTEMTALGYLLESLVEQEKYEVACIARDRMVQITNELSTFDEIIEG
jgi:protein-arginine kinase activator protein McsA